jgi:hypothetical protein
MAKRVETAVSGQLPIKHDPVIERMVQLVRQGVVLDTDSEKKREQYLAEFESDQGWEEVIREVSPNNQSSK